MPLWPPTGVFFALGPEQFASSFRPAVMKAVQCDEAQTLQSLLHQVSSTFADPKGLSQLTQSLLMLAAEKGALACLNALLPLADGFEIRGGRNPLTLAADRGHLDCVKAILATSRPQELGRHQRAVLRIASDKGDLACVEWLLQTSDDQVAKTGHARQEGCVYLGQGQPPLHLAVQEGRLECARAAPPQ